MTDAPPATGIEALVCADIAARQQAGRHKYGRTLAENPANMRKRLQHAYEETLDHANYLKWSMELLPPFCRQCGGDGFVEIQSGPYTRTCDRCVGTGSEPAAAP